MPPASSQSQRRMRGQGPCVPPVNNQGLCSLSTPSHSTQSSQSPSIYVARVYVGLHLGQAPLPQLISETATASVKFGKLQNLPPGHSQMADTRDGCLVFACVPDADVASDTRVASSQDARGDQPSSKHVSPTPKTS